jgi:hypothetical protein
MVDNTTFRNFVNNLTPIAAKNNEILVWEGFFGEIQDTPAACRYRRAKDN